MTTGEKVVVGGVAAGIVWWLFRKKEDEVPVPEQYAAPDDVAVPVEPGASSEDVATIGPSFQPSKGGSGGGGGGGPRFTTAPGITFTPSSGSGSGRAQIRTDQAARTVFAARAQSRLVRPLRASTSNCLPGQVLQNGQCISTIRGLSGTGGPTIVPIGRL